MAYKLLVTEAAHEDLDEALGYIASPVGRDADSLHSAVSLWRERL